MNSQDIPALCRSTCGKSELAMAYFPGLAPSSARRNLYRWIHRNPQLCARLSEAGYQPKQHYYTPMQVGIIYDVFGEP